MMIERIDSLPNLGGGRRIRVPADWRQIVSAGEESDPAEVGVDPAAVDAIWRTVCNWYRTGLHPAIQVCLRRDGRTILNRAIGHARGNGPDDDGSAPKTLATVDTPFCVFSASKGVTATLIHLLAERGALRLEDRAVDHLPWFTGHGKEAITIRHLLEHTAGVPFTPARYRGDFGVLNAPERIPEVLAALRPVYSAGRLRLYHPATGGLVLGEIVRAATGTDIRDILRQEILEPLGFRWTNYGMRPEDQRLLGHSALTGRAPRAPISTGLRWSLGADYPEFMRRANDPEVFGFAIPSGNVVSTAAELARFYEMLGRGGELDGVRVMRASTLEQAVRPRYRFTELPGMRAGSGFVLGSRRGPLGRDTETLFGHPGLTAVMAWADPARGLSGAIVSSGKPVTAGNFYLALLMNQIARAVPIGATRPGTVHTWRRAA